MPEQKYVFWCSLVIIMSEEWQKQNRNGCLCLKFWFVWVRMPLPLRDPDRFCWPGIVVASFGNSTRVFILFYFFLPMFSFLFLSFLLTPHQCCSAHLKMNVSSCFQSKKSRLSSSSCHWLDRCGILRRRRMRRGSSGSKPSRVRYLPAYSHVKVARIR